MRASQHATWRLTRVQRGMDKVRHCCFVAAKGRKQPASTRDWNIHRIESSATREMTKQM